jgi:hypothetical protein
MANHNDVNHVGQAFQPDASLEMLTYFRIAPTEEYSESTKAIPAAWSLGSFVVS